MRDLLAMTLLGGLASVALACHTSTPRPAVQEEEKTMNTSEIRIKEPTVGEVAGVRVSVYNIWQRDDAQAPSGEGPTAALHLVDLEEKPRIVGAGSTVRIGDADFEVVSVQARKADDTPGFVVLRPVSR
jgi:hypothetical protein